METKSQSERAERLRKHNEIVDNIQRLQHFLHTGRVHKDCIERAHATIANLEQQLESNIARAKETVT